MAGLCKSAILNSTQNIAFGAAALVGSFHHPQHKPPTGCVVFGQDGGVGGGVWRITESFFEKPFFAPVHGQSAV
jgi:hypothetical protein